MDLVTSSQILREKDIQPSKVLAKQSATHYVQCIQCITDSTPFQLNFGFLGLGIMGSGIVKNLLNSGHTVTVWNRTVEKVKLLS